MLFLSLIVSHFTGVTVLGRVKVHRKEISRDNRLSARYIKAIGRNKTHLGYRQKITRTDTSINLTKSFD